MNFPSIHAVIIVLTTMLLPAQTAGQVVTIERIQERSLKFRQSNYLQVVLQDISCDSVILRSSAKLEKCDSYSPCTWIVTPMKYAHLPGLKIEVLKLVNSDTVHVEDRYFRIEKLSPLVLQCGQYNNGDTVTREEIVKEIALSAFERFGQYHCFSTAPIDFKCILVRNGVTSLIMNSGARFSKELLDEFKTLNSGDYILFYDINFQDAVEDIYIPNDLLKLVIK